MKLHPGMDRVLDKDGVSSKRYCQGLPVSSMILPENSRRKIQLTRRAMKISVAITSTGSASSDRVTVLSGKLCPNELDHFSAELDISGNSPPTPATGSLGRRFAIYHRHPPPLKGCRRGAGRTAAVRCPAMDRESGPAPMQL